MTLYKYRGFDGPFGRSNIEGIIRDGQLYWPSPLSFNDPFDCAPNVYFGASPAERRTYVRRMLQNPIAGSARHERRQTRRTINARSRPEFERLARTFFRDLMGTTGVMSFASEVDNPLLWAHYGANYTGVCFEFVETTGRWIFIAHEIEYADHRPPVNLVLLDQKETMKAIVLTKSRHWSYEREYRMIDYKGGPGRKLFPPHALRSITLGPRIAKADRDWLLGLNASRGTPLPVRQARLSETTYEILFEDV